MAWKFLSVIVLMKFQKTLCLENAWTVITFEQWWRGIVPVRSVMQTQGMLLSERTWTDIALEKMLS